MNNEQLLNEKMTTHKETGQCQCNFEGTSGSMEKQMALNMWNRSEEKNTMRYSTMISDGDASTYSAICDNVDYLVEKKECIKYFSKQFGTRLRILKKEYVPETMTKTGITTKLSVFGGRGKLTDTTIQYLAVILIKQLEITKVVPLRKCREHACQDSYISLVLMKIKNMNTALQARTHGPSTKKLSH